jgi:hypothetical protein
VANCIYCGKPVGFLRKHHAVCGQQHHAAAAKIPGFFVKYLESSLSGERFHMLAVNVAKANYIGDEELRQLATKGFSALIDSLANRALSERENDRIAGIRNAFGLGHGDIGAAGPKLTKAKIGDLEQGRALNHLAPKHVLANLRQINLKQIAISLSKAPKGGRGLIIVATVFIFANFLALLAGGYIVFALMGAPHYATNKNSETGARSAPVTEEKLRAGITHNYSCQRVHEFRLVGLDKTGSVYLVDCGHAIYQVLVDAKGVMTAGFACGDGWQCGTSSRN